MKQQCAPGWDTSPSQDTHHEAARSITASPGWDASLTVTGYPQILLGLLPNGSLEPIYIPGRKYDAYGDQA